MQNIVILAGNIGQSPEVRTTQGGTKITNFTLATSRPRLAEGRVQRDENGYRVMDTEWHRITCFNGLGKTVADNCEKGMKVMVHGRSHYTKWTDAAGAVFVKGVVRRFHAASLISGALISFSGLSQTGPAGRQLRVLPDQRCGFCARAIA